MLSTDAILVQAQEAKKTLGTASTEVKNHALRAMADALVAGCEDILAANAADCADAEGTISTVMMDRLLLTKERIHGMADGVLALIDLPDPVGQVRRRATPKPGMVMMEPVSATMKPAPADTFTWRTVIWKSRGAPSLV